MAAFPAGPGGFSVTGGGSQSAGGITAVLATLKDVAGIAGSFVFTASGQLFAREMHPMFDDAALGEASTRLMRLHDTFAAIGDQLDLAVIRFQDHRLYLKVVSGGMLCILADGMVNMAALRMAANLVARRVAGDLDRAARVGGEITAPASAPVVESIPGAPAAAGARPGASAPATRRFRGRTIG